MKINPINVKIGSSNLKNNNKIIGNYRSYEDVLDDGLNPEEIADISIDFIINALNDTEDYPEIIKDEFKPQGYTYSDDMFLISAYKDGSNSRIYMYDKKTGDYLGIIELNFEAHVGGITYNPDNGLLFITENNGKIKVYDYNAIVEDMEKSHSSSVRLSELMQENDAIFLDEFESGFDKAATVYYHNGKLYVSTFVGTHKGRMKVYDIKKDENGNLIKELNYEAECPPQTQGIAVTEHNGKQYIVFSQSYGKGILGRLEIYELKNDGTTNYIGNIYCDDGVEGVNIDEYGNLTYITEFHSTINSFSFEDLLEESKIYKSYRRNSLFYFPALFYDIKNKNFNFFSDYCDLNLDVISRTGGYKSRKIHNLDWINNEK